MIDTIETPISQKTTGSRPATAKKPLSLIGMEPATDVESYDSVPWYRRQWFALFPVFALALLFTAPTGDVYAKATKPMKKYSDANVWRYTPASRAFFVACVVFTAVYWSIVLWG